MKDVTKPGECMASRVIQGQSVLKEKHLDL